MRPLDLLAPPHEHAINGRFCIPKWKLHAFGHVHRHDAPWCLRRDKNRGGREREGKMSRKPRKSKNFAWSQGKMIETCLDPGP